MSHKIKEKDWWLLFNHMSESKLKQRHEEYVDIIETNKKEYWFIQIHNTSFVKLKFEDDINDNLIEKVANWAKKRNNTSKIGISQYFFLSFIKKNSSFKNSIKTDYLN